MSSSLPYKSIYPYKWDMFYSFSVSIKVNLSRTWIDIPPRASLACMKWIGFVFFLFNFCSAIQGLSKPLSSWDFQDGAVIIEMWGRESSFPSKETQEREGCLLQKAGKGFMTSMQIPSCVQPLSQAKKRGFTVAQAAMHKWKKCDCTEYILEKPLLAINMQPMPGCFPSPTSLTCGQSEAMTDIQLRIQRPKSTFIFMLHIFLLATGLLSH